MTDAIEITAGVYQPLREYDGRRVVTFKDIDTVHKRPEGTARKRFNDNREHFIEGVDFYRATQREVCPKNGHTPNGYNPNGVITLLTETGYLMLVKSFTDDLAWTVQRSLVNCYFRAKEVAQPLPTRPLTADDYIRAASIVAGCKNERLPLVLDLLKKGGYDIPKLPESTEAGREQLADEATQTLQTAIDEGATIQELADALGVARTQVWRYVHGIIKPRPDRAKQIITIITTDTKEF